MIHRTAFFLAIFVLLIGLLVACNPGSSPEVPQEDTVTNEAPYIIGDRQGDWGYPSPYSTYPRGPGYLRMYYIFDTLVWKDHNGFVGALAEEYDFDPAKLSYTFNLREGVKWHDGTSFSADDVIFTFDYLREHPMPLADISVIEEVIKLDQNTVKITLKRPYASFLNNLAGALPILPEHIWEKVDQPKEFAEPEALIGTGPYQLKSYSREQGRYHYQSFTDYYLGEPLVEELLMVKVSDPQMALQNGDVDFAQVEPEAVELLENTGFLVESGTHDWCLKLIINHREEPFSEMEFRRALALAIDLDKLVERALRGHGLPGSPGLVSPDNRWYCEEFKTYGYDPQAAVEKLEALGYSFDDGMLKDETGEPLSLELITHADYAREAEIVGAQLSELGLDLDVRSMERSVIDSYIRNWDFDLAITGHGAVGGDPETLQRFMVGEGSPHLNARYQDENLIEALEQQSRALDETEREEAVCEAQRLHAEAVPAYPLYYPTWYYAHNEKVNWFFTKEGIGTGIPIPLNKLALVE
ncbi:MAG: ABC transporter substrate-binding protein [Bacillota bacterium]